MFSLATFSSVQSRNSTSLIDCLHLLILTILYFVAASETMDNLPPNDPNRGNEQNGRQAAKEQPFDGNRRNRNGGGNNGTEDGEPMDIMGDMRDSPAVAAMFLVYVAAWFLRERCVC